MATAIHITKPVTVADLNRANTIWNNNPDPSVYYIYPRFVEAVACGRVWATESAVIQARAEWESIISVFQAGITGAPT